MPDGTPTSEVENLRQALRPLRKLYADTPTDPKSREERSRQMQRARLKQEMAGAR